MASEYQVKQYIAYWVQLGKKVVIRNGQQELLPEKIIAGDRYSQEFEDCWQQILSPNSGDCYIEGTDETIAELLTPEWDIMLCSRCVMPVPVRTQGMPPNSCPCFDLPSWPNSELPQPRDPISSKAHLSSIRHRIATTYKPESSKEQESDHINSAPPTVVNFPRCHLRHG